MARTPKPSTLALAALLASTLGALGCGAECSLLGCRDGFHLELVPAAPLPAETHTLILEIEGERIECPFEWPLPSNGRTPCGSEVLLSAGPTSLFVWSPGSPASVRVRLSRADDVLVDTTAELDYAPFYPNGESCDGACMTASANVRTR